MPEAITRGSRRSAKGVGRARRRGLGRPALGLLVTLAAWAQAGAAQAEPTAAARAQAEGSPAKGAGAARPVEPEKHQATRPGEGVEVPGRALAPSAAAQDPAPSAGDMEPRRPTPYGVRPDPIHRSLMWVTGGLTLAGIALGSSFGGLAIATWDKVDDEAKTACANPRRYRDCAQPVPDLASKAMSYATVSDFSFIAASVALAGTAVLWLTLPSDGPRAAASVQLAPGVVGGSVVGVF
ncbi:hypothetical protein [Sorangium atrum]|uniref:Uncharacterized protein n=1 Tax=Sorangium atrum TaxID=2995308 RepID=A0ABT5BTR3_9BACT|nr:hypothetical protein [Sorangium aterium]MDC0676934.1 hypothetical protein [Sorangium aterium]